jgi:hypothetical protein
LLAVSLTFWNWATQAKFYGLHYIFVVALFWLGWRAHRALRAETAGGDAPGTSWAPRTWSPATRLLHAIVAVTGLALTNHFQTFFVLPGIAVLVVTGLRTLPEIRQRLLRYTPTLVPAGLVPLMLYLYLPIRAGMQPLFAWGQPTTLPAFWRQVTAQNYQHLFSSGNLGTHLVDAGVYAANQFGPILTLLLLVPMAAGVRYLWGTHRSLLLATGGTAGLSLLVDVNYNIPEIATYYVPIYMIGLFWAGLGVAGGVRWLLGQAVAQRAAGLARWGSLPAGALLPLVALLINAGAAGHRDNYTAELFIQNAFKSLPPNAILLTDYWDLSSLSFYWQHVRGERPDVVVIDKELLRQPFYIDYLQRAYPDVMAGNAAALSTYKGLLQHWVDTGQATRELPAAYTDTLNGFVDSNLGRRPVYTAFITPVSDTQGRREIAAVLDPREAQLVPAGLGYHIVAPGEDGIAHDPHFDFRGLLTDPVPLDEIERSVVAVYPGFVQQLSSYLQSHPDPADPQAAARLQAQAAALQPFKVYQDERPRLR